MVGSLEKEQGNGSGSETHTSFFFLFRLEIRSFRGFLRREKGELSPESLSPHKQINQ